MKTESGSTTISAPTSRSPAESQVQSRETSLRSSCSRPSSWKKTAREQMNEIPVAPAARTPAAKRLIRSPASVIATTAAAGEKRQVHARAVTASLLAPERGQAVDVEVDAPAGDRNDEAEAEHRLGGRHDHDGEREDLAVPVAELARERDQRQVAGVQHELEGEQDDQRAPADEDAERARAEEHHREDEVGGDAGAAHGRPSRSFGIPPPRTTPPTAATSRTMDVTSKASKWSERNRVPISAGEPKLSAISAVSLSRSSAWSAITTTTSTAIAAVATTAASAWSDGPPAHGVSARPPR